MKYKKLLEKADILGVEIVDCNLPDAIKGLYCEYDKNCIIGLNKNIKTANERTCVLAEELGHCITSYGDILTRCNVTSRKQENNARGWAYSKMIPFTELIAAEKSGCKNIFEVAHFLSVTQEFLSDALGYFQNKYGCYLMFKGYRIYFDPLWVIREDEWLENQPTHEW